MKRVLSVRRKGFNYYTDYTELYLHRAFQNYGYSVVREREKSEFSVLVYISENEKHMKMISPFFDELCDSDIASLCEFFSEAFKSEVIMEDNTDYNLEKINEYEFMLSKNYSAYDEPTFLYDEPPKLRKSTYFINFQTNKNNSVSFVNVGGSFSGVTVSFDFNDDVGELEFSCAHVCYYENKDYIRREFAFEKNNNSFKADMDFIRFDKGVNPVSAVMRGKKRQNEENRHGFWLGVLPVSKENTVLKGTLTVSTDGVEIFKGEI